MSIPETMQKIIFFLSSLVLLTAIACKNNKNTKDYKDNEDNTIHLKEWSELPLATSLDSLKGTDFVSTLENPLNPERNTVYAAALLYAWDTVTKLLPGDIDNDSSYKNDFNLLRKSNSFRNSLAKDEYSVKTEVGEGYIIAKAFFNKTLPFPANMEKADMPMLFAGQEVKAFGMYGTNSEIASYSQILFYDNDDRFLIKLSPQDQKHEVWLMKAMDTDTTLSAVVQRAKEWKAAGEKDAGNAKLAWKYGFNAEDILSIPEVKFNIETHYKQLEGQIFFMKSAVWFIKIAYQRTGFILNETGAVAESEALMRTDTMSISLEKKILPKPKKMVFDKPFYIILKRTDSENPYFVMRVANAELLVKQ
jgi:hypothetical protein